MALFTRQKRVLFSQDDYLLDSKRNNRCGPSVRQGKIVTWVNQFLHWNYESFCPGNGKSGGLSY